MTKQTNPKKVRYGYRLDAGRQVEDPAQQEVVKMILQMDRNHMGPGKITTVLNSQQIPAAQGGKWYAKTVNSVIEANDHRYPEIVDELEVEKCLAEAGIVLEGIEELTPAEKRARLRELQVKWMEPGTHPLPSPGNEVARRMFLAEDADRFWKTHNKWAGEDAFYSRQPEGEDHDSPEANIIFGSPKARRKRQAEILDRRATSDDERWWREIGRQIEAIEKLNEQERTTTFQFRSPDRMSFGTNLFNSLYSSWVFGGCDELVAAITKEDGSVISNIIRRLVAAEEPEDRRDERRTLNQAARALLNEVAMLRQENLHLRQVVQDLNRQLNPEDQVDRANPEQRAAGKPVRQRTDKIDTAKVVESFSSERNRAQLRANRKTRSGKPNPP